MTKPLTPTCSVSLRLPIPLQADLSTALERFRSAEISSKAEIFRRALRKFSKLSERRQREITHLHRQPLAGSTPVTFEAVPRELAEDYLNCEQRAALAWYLWEHRDKGPAPLKVDPRDLATPYEEVEP
jgi:hypothetical protein